MGFSKFARYPIGNLIHYLRNERLLRQLTLLTDQARGPSLWVSGAHQPVLDRGSQIIGSTCPRIACGGAHINCAWWGYADFVVASLQYLNQIRMQNEPAFFVAYISVRLVG